VSLTFYRFFFGGIVLLLILAAMKDLSGMGVLLRKNKLLFFISSVIGLGFSNITYFIGIKMTEPHVGAALYTSYALFIGIYSIFILNERSNIPLKITGFLLGLGATILLGILTANSSQSWENPVLGNFLLVMSGAIWGFYSVLGKKIMRRHPEIKNVDVKFSTLSFFLACIPPAIALPFLPEGAEFMQNTLVEWTLIGIMSVVVTAIGVYLFYHGCKFIDVSLGISNSLLKPIFSALFAFLLLARPVPIAMFISIPLVSIAVLLINKKPKKRIALVPQESEDFLLRADPE
jgi:drug/metabolite transporter (DMT)-like permease